MKYVICNHINLTQRQKTNTGERLEEKKGTQKGTSRPINKTKKKTKGMKYKKKKLVNGREHELKPLIKD